MFNTCRLKQSSEDLAVMRKWSDDRYLEGAMSDWMGKRYLGTLWSRVERCSE